MEWLPVWALAASAPVVYVLAYGACGFIDKWIGRRLDQASDDLERPLP